MADSESALIHSIIVQHLEIYRSFLITHAFQSFSCLSLLNPLFFSIHAASLQKTFWQITNLHDNFLRERKGKSFLISVNIVCPFPKHQALVCLVFFWRIRPKIKKEKGWPGDKGQKIRGAGHQLEQCFSKGWQKRMLEWDSLFSGCYFV